MFILLFMQGSGVAPQDLAVSDPLCVGGQFYHPSRSDSTYVQCVNGECTQQRCPRRTTWNQDNLRCEGGNG